MPPRMSANQIIANAKKDFQQFYNIPDGVNPETRRTYLRDALDKYEGLNLATELESLAEFHKININIFESAKRYKPTDRIKLTLIRKVVCKTEINDTINLIQVTLRCGRKHLVRIVDDRIIQNDYEICPHCNKFVHDKAYDRAKNHRSRFMKHVQKCELNDGKLAREVSLQPCQKPYAPHITKQPIYEFLLAYNQPNLFRPTKAYITYDFETLEDLDKACKAGDSTDIHAGLVPFMVSSTVCIGAHPETRNFNHTQSTNFIHEWITFLFEQAENVYNANYNAYFLNPEFVTFFDTLKPEAQEHLTHLINRETRNIPVIGFNSSKFDINLFLPELCCDKWLIKSIVGSSTTHKIVTVRSNEETVKTILKFIDIRCYLAGGTLDEFTRDFGSTDVRVKNFFPYEYVTLQNYKTTLFDSTPFPQESFKNTLSNSGISDADYNTYLQDMKNFESRLDYFIHYCNVDTQIMVEPINNLIDIFFEHNVDMLHNSSLSSNASMIRYSKLYPQNFTISVNKFVTASAYDSGYAKLQHSGYAKLQHSGYAELQHSGYAELSLKAYFMSREYWQKRCNAYLLQDKRANRDVSNNVSISDFHHFEHVVLNSTCKLCNEPFSHSNKPSFDRIDNSLPHTRNNLQVTCIYCNKAKADNDENLAKLRINLRKYALQNNLPMTLAITDTDAYYIIRDGITGGLSNVQHRVNLKNITRINKLSYDPNTRTVSDKDTEHIMTHFIGNDFNSLYPSVHASTVHKFIKYTDNKIYMPGRLTSFTHTTTPSLKRNAIKLINQKDTLFIVEIKGHIEEEFINEFINLPPIFRNIDIEMNPETIGNYMYDYCKENSLLGNVCKPEAGSCRTSSERKLTQLLSTHDQFMSFSSYYLWFLIDRCHFVIDDIRSIMTFTKMDKFSEFVTSFMDARQTAELEGKKGKAAFCKIALNGSYGYDAMNTEKYGRKVVTNLNRAGSYVNSHLYRDITEINEEMVVVTLDNERFKCETCLHEAFFTLDNAKYWYLLFIYDFMYKCLDMDRIHFIEGDTDSAYWAIAGDPTDSNEQGFKHVIKDHEFYNENVFHFMPYDFYCSDETKRPQLTTPKERKAHEKKLLGLAIEKQGDNMVALCPKCYTSWNEDEDGVVKIKATKCKGVSIKQNKLSHTDYCDVLFNSTTKEGSNTGLRKMGGQMVKYTVYKAALSGKHTKGVTQANGCVHPFIRRSKTETSLKTS